MFILFYFIFLNAYLIFLKKIAFGSVFYLKFKFLSHFEA